MARAYVRRWPRPLAGRAKNDVSGLVLIQKRMATTAPLRLGRKVAQTLGLQRGEFAMLHPNAGKNHHFCRTPRGFGTV